MSNKENKNFYPIILGLFLYTAQADGGRNAKYDSAIDFGEEIKTYETELEVNSNEYAANSIIFGDYESDSENAYGDDLPTAPEYMSDDWYWESYNYTESNGTDSSGIQYKALRPTGDPSEEIAEEYEISTIIIFTGVCLLFITGGFGAGFCISRRPSGSETRSSTNRTGLSRGLSSPDEVVHENQPLVDDDVFEIEPMVTTQNKATVIEKV